MSRHPLFNFIFGSLLGLMLGGALTMKMSQPAIAHAQTALQDQAEVIRKLQAQVEGQRKNIASLLASLEYERQHPAIQALAKSGHVMDEAQCRAWIGVMAPAKPADQVSIATVLYESQRASVNLSLLPLPGAPRVAIGPHSQMAPRWIIPGRIQPQMVGETRQAAFYYFDANSANWQGPFSPERVR
jgi:hypothetical protein